jgi:hypothetical protein
VTVDLSEHRVHRPARGQDDQHPRIRDPSGQPPSAG